MSRDELPPVLRDLGDQLREAAARDIEVERRVSQRLRSGRWRRRLFVALAALVSAGGIAVAQRLLDHSGPDHPRDRIQRPDRPAADPGVIVSSAVPDPGIGPPWALRVFTNTEGMECVALGRLRNGALGTYDETRTFRKLPAFVPGTCERLDRAGLLVLVQRRAWPDSRTIVYGLARDGHRVRVTIGGVTHMLRPAGFGSFIDVRAGRLNLSGAKVSTSVAGRTVTRGLG
jgi:hypothetical protein